MTGFKLEDPTIDVDVVESYRLAFLMQFFVQHKRRFRFPRLRLQDLYQNVVKDSDTTAFCDLVARILRFLSHGDPDICIDKVDQALDRFTVDKRTPYRVNVQRHRSGKPVHQLGIVARAALLENLIESVYDEQPDFNFTSGFNNSNSANGTRGLNGSSQLDTSEADAAAGLFGDLSSDEANEFGESEDVNVVIKAGQDAQGCSYYYMDDLRLYRERPQSGISSQWDVAVGPTTSQWMTFIVSLSRNEKEYDLYCFLKQELFELVKQSLDSDELRAMNTDMDSNYLRTKEASELTELRRRKGLSTSKLLGDMTDNGKLSLSSITGIGNTGPKSASPAFSGGHGACGIGSSGSTSSGAPLTPSSARTPTSAPPAATASSGFLPPCSQPFPLSNDGVELILKSEHDPRTPNSTNWPTESPVVAPRPHLLLDSAVKTPCPDAIASQSPGQRPTEENVGILQTNGFQTRTTIVPKPEPSENAFGAGGTALWPREPGGDSGSPMLLAQSPSAVTNSQVSGTSWSSPVRLPQGPNSQPSSAIRQQSTPLGPEHRVANPGRKLSSEEPPSSTAIRSELSSIGQDYFLPSTSTANLPIQNPTTQSTTALKQQVYAFDSSPERSMSMGPEFGTNRIIVSRSSLSEGTMVAPDGMGNGDRQVLSGTKPTTPMASLPDAAAGSGGGTSTLTQEQWENRKSKIAQLEKIHSTLSKSKSASTPGAVAAAAGAVLQQQQRMQQGGVPSQMTVMPQVPVPAGQQNFPGPAPQVGNNFGNTPYPQHLQRPMIPDGYPMNRLPSPMTPGGVGPPSEMAQREWDRLCMDYQREKGDLSGGPPRFHPPCRQSVMYDSSGACTPLVRSDLSMHPSNPMMMPTDQLTMEQQQTIPGQATPRPYGTQLEGPGPPVLMVPPNNSNPTAANAGYPPIPGSGPHARPMMHHPSSELQMQSGGIVPTSQKRPYYGSHPGSGDSWLPSNGMIPQIPGNDPSNFPGNLPPTPITGSTLRNPGLGPIIPSTVPIVTSNTVTSSTGGSGRGVGKTGGKKRKTAVSGRSSASNNNNNTSTTTTSNASTMAVQTQQSYGPYGSNKNGNPSAGAVTPARPQFLSSSYQLIDPNQTGFHQHRSAYGAAPGVPHMMPSNPHYPGMDSYYSQYSDLPGGSDLGRSMNATGTLASSDGRRAVTPKSCDTFPSGPGVMGSVVGGGGANGLPMGRLPPPNYPMSFPTGATATNPAGLCGPNSMQPTDASGGMGCDMNATMRPPVSCVQHLTSASLASLARLSQLSGPEGPCVPSSTSSNATGLGNSMGSNPGMYSNRSYHCEAPSIMTGTPHLTGPSPPSMMRSHHHQQQQQQHHHHQQQSGPTASMKMQDPDMQSVGLPHHLSSVGQSKFGPQMYAQPAPIASTQPSLPSATGPQQQQQSQHQTPSIQVNNTFFNAQLNVQQMNYQQVSAPGSTGQMQIHFVQQQQQQQQHEHSRSSRLGDSTTTRPGPNSTAGGGMPQYYPTPNAPETMTNSSSSRLSSSMSAGSNLNGSQGIKSDSIQPPCSGLQPPMSLNTNGPPVVTSGGYGNASIQITPRTPHTIQYLPTVAPSSHHPELPSHGSSHPSYMVASSPQTSQPPRSKMPRVASNLSYSGSVDPNGFSHPDMIEAVRQGQTTTNPVTMYNTPHSTAHPSYPQQQSYGPTMLQQPNHTGGGGGKTVQSQIPAASANIGGSSARSNVPGAQWNGMTDVSHFDGHLNGVPDSLDPVQTAGRLPNHPGTRVGYPMGYPGESIDLGSDPNWTGDPNYPHRTPHSRPQQTRSDSHQIPHMSHQTYRQQQQQQHYTHTMQQQQQQQQQHQMFMSSSMGNLPSDGLNHSGQMQFMMSASSASSSSMNVQTSTTIIGGGHDQSTNPNVPTDGRTGGSACNLPPDMKGPCGSNPASAPPPFDTLSNAGNKRGCLALSSGGGVDDVRGLPVSSFNPTQQHHMLSSGANRMNWSASGGGHVVDQSHLAASYTYANSGFPNAPAITGLGHQLQGPGGNPCGIGGNQSALHGDLPPNMSQQSYVTAVVPPPP